MSTSDPSSARDGHLDDEATLDTLDGVLAPAEAAHLGACATSAAEVARLEVARAAVAAPTPPVDGATRDAAIAAALAAFDRGGSARSTAGPVDLDAHRARRGAGSTAGRWIGVAAAVVALVVAVPLLSDLVTDRDGERSTAGGDATSAAGGEAADEESASALAAPGPVVDVGDLGTLGPDVDLRPVVDEALAPTPATGDAEDQAGAAGVPEPRPATAAQVEPCQDEIRAELPELGALLLVGTATVDDDPALVFGFDAPSAARPTVSLVVVGTGSCDLLTFQSYARG